MTNDSTWTTEHGYTIFVPKGSAAYIYPITGSATDDGAQIIDHAIALHHVTEQLDTGEDG